MRGTTRRQSGAPGGRSLLATRGLLAVVLAAGWTGASAAQAVEVRSRDASPGEPLAARAEPEAASVRSIVRVEDTGMELSFSTDPRAGLGAAWDAATAGTYDGTVAGKPFSLTVSGGKITGWTVEDLDCPGFSVVEAGVTTSCSIAGNDSFTCGSLGCSPAIAMRISGSFAGDTVGGTFDMDFQPFGSSCCKLRGLGFAATREGGGGGGGGGSAPAAPTNLTAIATSDDEVDLDWTDHANNESEFRIELRKGTSGAFTDVGGVGANARASVSGLDPATLYQFRVRARNASGDSPYSNVASATTLGGASSCVPSGTAMCLNGDRFRVQANFDTGESSGTAQVVKLTADTGYLWFFSDSNVEVVVKVLDACGLNGRYWVFAGGLTNVHTVITVTDTHSGAVRTYINPQGTAFKPVQDTGAFATCP